VKISVPGNLLLLGEYAVLEPGGLGIALAVEPRLRLAVEPGRALTVAGEWAGGRIGWSARDTEGEGLPAAVHRAFLRWKEGHGEPLRDPVGRVRIDSSALQKGCGSSAAAAVALAGAFLGLAGVPAERRASAGLRIALEGHRRVQGGRGSGYDVAASLFGGVGLFQGGAVPGWTPLRLPWLPPFRLVGGALPVATPEAISRYEGWKAARPGPAQEFLRRSNELVLRFARARSWREAAGLFQAGAELGLRLGEEIGVEARLPALPLEESSGEESAGEESAGGRLLLKALGAGNELGALFPPEAGRQRWPAGQPADGRPVEIAREGIRWENGERE
jgi:phosphomevalonate kinase